MRNFDSALTLFESAQVFHFRRIEGEYCAVVGGRVITERDETDFAKAYFDDARDYAAVMKSCEANAVAYRAMQLLPGMRVLNQPPWEALIAFILSANNNVKRIRALVSALNENYGKAFEYRGEKLFGFPEPEVLKALKEEELRERVKCGYRAKYLIGTAQMVADGFPLDSLKNMPYEEARRLLMQLPGVGGKVADCVLLFGLGHACAFPVDVWVDRLMREWFGITCSREQMRMEARRILGDECGLIQQSLFHAARTGLIDVK